VILNRWKEKNSDIGSWWNIDTRCKWDRKNW